MKKIILLSYIMICGNISLPAESWGPKILFDIKNDVGQSAKLYIGVDSLASDGWDSGIVFNYYGKDLKEDIDLPPPPPKSMYATLVRDSLTPFGSFTYVDMRGIRNFDKFFHKYRINIRWYYTGNPWIIIDWGELPYGIDSAKLHCYEWFDDEYYLDMGNNSKILLDNEYEQNFDIYVWYNKLTTIEELGEKIEIYPNPAEDVLSVGNVEGMKRWVIFDINGKEVLSGEKIIDRIDIGILGIGKYTIMIERADGKILFNKFIKKINGNCKQPRK